MHLNIQMTGPPGVLKLLLLAVILLHLPDCVQEEQYEDGNLVTSLYQSCRDSWLVKDTYQNIKVIYQLALQPLQEPGLEDFVPGAATQS